MSTLLTDVPSGTGGGPANPIPQEVREKINEYADKYAFRVPYDGTNNFYDEEALKHFLAGAEYGYSLALPRIKELEEENERLRKLNEKKDEYINLLGDEIRELASTAFATRGWKSTRFEGGVKLREEIQALAGKKEGEK
jgi:hypothetical protein